MDLDGTLIASDSMWEAALLLARKRPLDLLLFPLWIIKGRPHFKQKLFDRAMPDAALLPYRQDLLAMLRQQKEQGAKLVLATGSDQRMAAAVCQHLGIFDDYIATDGITNMTRERKLAELERRFGAGGFDYAGNSAADLCLWRAARRSYLVDVPPLVKRRALATGTPAAIFDYSRGRLSAAVRALRPHQWMKNLLVLLPLVLAHQLNDRSRVAAAVWAFWAFCLCASAIYIVNDLLDLESDRKHPTKRNRAFASGQLQAPLGLAMAGTLLLAAFAICFAEPPAFLLALATYFIATCAYSLWLKRRLLVDVFLLAGLYTIRLIAGAVGAQVPMSMWLLAFSMFFFLSLAFAKRYAELLQVQEAGAEVASGRMYLVSDLRIIEGVGPASGYLAVLVFCNYLDSPKATLLYHHPHLLWLIAPILLYWITRIWFLARRGALDQDPILFALRD
ncbi:MAG TPA: UbiA family prenyltransferase, partial [Bryobacteraceae bacterium]|nr:UbiA family prenyltransferase [Bryobacteraceae bacterium]